MKLRTLAAMGLIGLLAAILPVTAATADDEGDDDGTLEFHGIVESLPSASDLVGDWVVSGVTVHVTTRTTIEEEHGPVAVGAAVEVKGLAEADGSVTATKIETKESADDDVRLIGTVASFPAGGSLLGTWRVSHHTVRVVQATRIRHADRLHRGSDVRVVGRWTPKGALRASRITVRS